jgi:hypothetical protein
MPARKPVWGGAHVVDEVRELHGSVRWCGPRVRARGPISDGPRCAATGGRYPSTQRRQRGTPSGGSVGRPAEAAWDAQRRSHRAPVVGPGGSGRHATRVRIDSRTMRKNAAPEPSHPSRCRLRSGDGDRASWPARDRSEARRADSRRPTGRHRDEPQQERGAARHSSPNETTGATR